MGPSKSAAQWAVENPTIARGRLLTVVRHLSDATIQVGRMLGNLDVAHMSSNTANAAELHIELGMDETQRALLHAVHALDLADTAPRGEEAGPPFETSRDVLAAAVTRLRSGRTFTPGSIDARRLAVAIELLMDVTIGGKRK